MNVFSKSFFCAFVFVRLSSLYILVRNNTLNPCPKKSGSENQKSWNPLIRGQRTIKIQKITHFLIPKIVTLRRAHSSIVLMCLIFNENTWGDEYEYYQYAHEILVVFTKYYENAKRFSVIIKRFSLHPSRERARHKSAEKHQNTL